MKEENQEFFTDMELKTFAESVIDTNDNLLNLFSLLINAICEGNEGRQDREDAIMHKAELIRDEAQELFGQVSGKYPVIPFWKIIGFDR